MDTGSNVMYGAVRLICIILIEYNDKISGLTVRS